MSKKMYNIKATEIGKVAMLIADMVDKGATDEELERAIKYSRHVVSLCTEMKGYEEVLGITELKRKYQ